MTFRKFQTAFNEILYYTPLPGEERWKFQELSNASLERDRGWFEVLYRTFAWSVASEKDERLETHFLSP
jgi:hypothetical protein